MYFFVKCEKTQEKDKVFEKKPRNNPRPSRKNPRTQDSIEKSKILGENPRSGNAAALDIIVNNSHPK